MQQEQTVYFGAGCFWGAQKFFDQILFIGATETGYANGKSKTLNVTYKEVCSGETDHVEVVKVNFNPELISFKDLLDLYFSIIDPTLKDQQGHDIGRQYRTGIYIPESEFAQLAPIAQEKLAQVATEYAPQPVYTEILPLENYVSAEDYHQKYLDKNPTGYCHIDLNDYRDEIQEINQQIASRALVRKV